MECPFASPFIWEPLLRCARPNQGNILFKHFFVGFNFICFIFQWTIYILIIQNSEASKGYTNETVLCHQRMVHISRCPLWEISQRRKYMRGDRLNSDVLHVIGCFILYHSVTQSMTGLTVSNLLTKKGRGWGVK